MTNTVIVKFEDEVVTQRYGAVKRIIGFVKAQNMLGLFSENRLGPNPRLSSKGSITDAIRESIRNTPLTLPFKTKGVLVAASRYRELERRRFELTFVNTDIEGVLDGGHNMLAIGMEILCRATQDDNLVRRKVNRWDDLISMWDQSADLIAEVKDQLDFVIPVEVLVPANQQEESDRDEFQKSLLEICEARNNNRQLNSEAASNKKGYYEVFKAVMPKEMIGRIEWKPNDGGYIKVRDLVALSWIPLSLLEDLKIDFAPQTIYVSKDKCSKLYDELFEQKEVAVDRGVGSEKELIHPLVISALSMLPKLMELYDKLYADFPAAYNGHFGKLKEVQLYQPEKAGNGGANAFGHERKYLKKQPLTTYFERPISYRYPEGWIVPLFFGLRALIARKGDKLEWIVDPVKFLDKNLPTIVEQYQIVMDANHNDPQKVGKHPGCYKLALGLFGQMLDRAEKAA